MLEHQEGAVHVVFACVEERGEVRVRQRRGALPFLAQMLFERLALVLRRDLVRHNLDDDLATKSRVSSQKRPTYVAFAQGADRKVSADRSGQGHGMTER
jgi:hypothetical protein